MKANAVYVGDENQTVDTIDQAYHAALENTLQQARLIDGRLGSITLQHSFHPETKQPVVRARATVRHYIFSTATVR